MIDSNNKIVLVFRKQDFEDIYFKDRQENIFFSNAVKQHFIIASVFAGLFLFSLVYSFFTNHNWGIPIVFFFIFIFSLLNYLRHAFPIIKWKKNVVKYLSMQAEVKSHALTLTNEALTITQDDKVTIIKWTSFTKAILENESITLVGSENCLFPKKSMHLKDYQYLKEFVSGKIQNG
jgi:c-di-AMP phosphodiesterase-like protein